MSETPTPRIEDDTAYAEEQRARQTALLKEAADRLKHLRRLAVVGVVALLWIGGEAHDNTCYNKAQIEVFARAAAGSEDNSKVCSVILPWNEIDRPEATAGESDSTESESIDSQDVGPSADKSLEGLYLHYNSAEHCKTHEDEDLHDDCDEAFQ